MGDLQGEAASRYQPTAASAAVQEKQCRLVQINRCSQVQEKRNTALHALNCTPCTGSIALPALCALALAVSYRLQLLPYPADS